MSIEVPRALVEFILLGPEDDRRQLQDSPILGDVWLEYARAPAAALELLITPYREEAAGTLAARLADFGVEGADIAYLQGIVAARLTFPDLVRLVVPLTHWFREKQIDRALRRYLSVPGAIEEDIGAILRAARQWLLHRRTDIAVQDVTTHKRYIALAGVLLWAGDHAGTGAPADAAAVLDRLLDQNELPNLVEALRRALPPAEARGRGLVWTVSLNRRASPALARSVPAVKADAARTLFNVDCSDIVWAVLDSGIDASHPAFLSADATHSRVAKSFDFTRIREIVSLDNLNDPVKRKERVQRLIAHGLRNPPTARQAETQLQSLAREARAGRPINWELVERLVEIDPARCPVPSNHGTHVAGILGGNGNGTRRMAERRRTGAAAARPQADAEDAMVLEEGPHGLCPDIVLYDFRVLGATLKSTEFAIIAALQYIRYINERNSFMTVHGANLSLSIPHDVRNYACGRTPVCNECERLVASGVVVVAAAGNRGYHNFETRDGLYEGYAAFSITDPGNADGVITVGATHRFWPHTYGVSFFSSRGPPATGA
jgi:serine protease AprX